MNEANTAWILVSTALVLLMTLPGLALFYAGLVGSKNTLSTLAQCFVIACIASIIWFICGYSLAFTGEGLYIGSLDKMFLSGIIDETKDLISQYGSDLSILETIGYCEARDVLNNHSTIDKAIELTTTKTIQFAKRQKTWFRNKNNPLWLNNKNLLKDAIIRIESFLG